MNVDLRQLVAEHESLTEKVADTMLPGIQAAAATISDALRADRRLFAFGNGGSAADAQHLAAELLGRFRREREPLAGIALTTDSSTLTAIGNDYDFRDVFARQVGALVQSGDVVVGISTSGEAENVVRGVAAANERGATTIALTGSGGGRLAQAARQSLVVPSDATARVQEMHVLLIHLICELVDEASAGPDERTR